MASCAFPFLLAMVFGLSLCHQYAHGQWTSRDREDFLDHMESEYRQLMMMQESMTRGMMWMEEQSEKSYREWMPKLEKDIARCRAAGNEAEAKDWERVKATFEEGHAATLERRRRGYKQSDPLDDLIVTEARKVLERVLAGRLPEESSILKLDLAMTLRQRIRSKDAYPAYHALIRVSKSLSAGRLLKH